MKAGERRARRVAWMLGIALAIALIAGMTVARRGGDGAPVAFDLSGRWTLTMNPDFKGNVSDSDCAVEQEDSKLTVVCGQGRQMRGTVRGRTVEWGFPPPNGEEYPAVRWIGTVERSETTIEGAWRLSLIGGDLEGKFKATKQ